jgi:uncharacterized membrane protein YeaQ/YmgE (transglycosylase-associated protein family)
LATAILPEDERGGFIITTLVGIGGAIVGGFVAHALGFGDPIDEFFDWSTWLAAIIGAIVCFSSTGPFGRGPEEERLTEAGKTKGRRCGAAALRFRAGLAGAVTPRPSSHRR